MARGTFYVTEKLGPKQSLTPEGFLLCEEVPIARTGMMIYGPDEVPISTGPDGIIRVFREEDEVFRAETIASANGKPVTNDHPEDDVTPQTWRELTVGVALNPRRGTGALDDLLLADFLVTTPEGIEAVRSGKVEVSCGYEADYEETAVGVGRQSNIIFNHVALVENGRCGPRCAIGDRQTINPKEKQMANKGRSKLVDALMKAFKAKDAEEVEQIAKEVADELPGAEGENGDTHIHIHAGGEGPAGTVTDEDEPSSVRANFTDEDIQAHIDQNASEHAEMSARIQALEELVASLAPAAATEDEEGGELIEQMKDEFPEEVQAEAVKAKDSAYLSDSYKDTVAMAEILVPGIRVPTFDRSAKPGQSFKKICGLRRQALDLAYAQPATRGMLDDLLAGKPLDTKNMTCDAIRTLFRSASTTQRSINNGAARTGDRSSLVQSQAGAHVSSLAELNRRNAERYGTGK